MSAADRQAAWAAHLVAGLVHAGVTHAVLSPGSRSTPLVLAVAAQPGLERLVVVDERCAAFTALGIARATGRPPLLVCTSGSAGAHYLPAVIEAAEADVPLLVLTADRPPELRARGALQTTDQQRLYGSHARLALDLGTAPDDDAALAAAAATAALAVARTLDPRPGPVHLNVSFRKPLEPHGALPTAPDVAPPRIVPARRTPDAGAVVELAAAAAATARGLLLLGPGGWSGEPGPLLELAQRLGWPLVADTASGLRGAAGVDLPGHLAPPAAPAPDLVVQLGRVPAAIGWARFVAGAAGERWVIAEHGVHDPAGSARGVVSGEPRAVVAALCDALGPGAPSDAGWSELWRRSDEAVAGVVADVLAEETAEGVLTEAGAAAALLAALPGDAVLALGNSLAVREVDRVPPPAGRVEVLSQRGVSGIDGSVSGAAGAALATRRPTALLTGDLALLHDLGGLAVARRVRTPLVLVVLANDGGRLFEALPVAGAVPPELFRELFLTPEPLDLEAAGAAFGVPVRSAATRSELERALAAALTHPGPTLVAARCVGEQSAARRAALDERVRAALAASP